MAIDNLLQRSFSQNLLLLKIVSIYPFDSHPHLFKIYSILTYVFLTIPACALPVGYLIVAKQTEISEIAQNGFIMMEMTVVAAKVVPLKLNPKKIVNTVTSLNQEIFKRQLPEQDHILLNVERNCLRINRVFATVACTSAIIWFCAPLKKETKSFPFDVWFPLDPYQNVFVYTFFYVWIVLAVANGSIVTVTLESMIASLIYHATGQLRVLKDTLIHLGRRTEEEVSKMGKSLTQKEKEEIKNRIIYKRICQCIDHYNTIYDFVQDIEDTFTYTVFGQFLANIVIICICIFQLSMADPFTIPFITTIFFSMDIFLGQFLFCYSGTLLRDESIAILDAAYTSDWYDFDEKCKRALMTLMERAKRPMTVTVGKLLELSLETFLTIIRRAYSLLAVLKNY